MDRNAHLGTLVEVSAGIVRRAARAGDIAELVRRRGELIEEAEAVPVSAEALRQAWEQGERARRLLLLEAARLRAEMQSNYREAFLLRALAAPPPPDPEQIEIEG